MSIPARRPENKNKVYVDVWALHSKDLGFAQPTHFKLSNDHVFKVDKILIRKRAAALKAGGQGDLYVLLAHPMQGAEASEPPPQNQYALYFDAPYWFLEVDDDWHM